MASGNGPWGGGNRGGSNGGNGSDGQRPGGGKEPGNQPVPPELDELVRKGQEQLRAIIGGKSGGGSGGGSKNAGPELPKIGRGGIAIGALILVAGWLFAGWLFASFYTVAPDQRGVEMFLGKEYRVTEDGPHFAWWPFISYEIVPALRENTETIGAPGFTTTSGNFRRAGSSGPASNPGLMLTTDENVVDVQFEVVWRISNPADFVFNLAGDDLEGGSETVRAVSESVMREVVAQFEFAPIINRERSAIAALVQELVQETLDEYQVGILILRVNLQEVEPPDTNITVITNDGNELQTSPLDAFRSVQAAEQERDTLQRRADAYANRQIALARGERAQILEAAEGYRAEVINLAEGEASRFLAVLTEYQAAPSVTRERLYLETMERVFGSVDKIILDVGEGESAGIVPYLPLNELRGSGRAAQ